MWRSHAVSAALLLLASVTFHPSDPDGTRPRLPDGASAASPQRIAPALTLINSVAAPAGGGLSVASFRKLSRKRQKEAEEPIRWNQPANQAAAADDRG